MNKLSVKGVAFAFGLCWGLGILFLGWIAAFGWGERMVEVLSSLYLGFRPGFLGGIIGAIWGFFDGAIGGLIVAFIYNTVTRKKVISGTAIAKNISLPPKDPPVDAI